ARAIRRAVLRDRFHSRRWLTPMARRTLKGSSPRALRPVSPEWKRRERGGRSARGRLRWTWLARGSSAPRRPATGRGWPRKEKGGAGGEPRGNENGSLDKGRQEREERARHRRDERRRRLVRRRGPPA